MLKFAETLSAAATEGQIDTDVPAAQSSPKPDDKANTQGCSDATQEKVEQLAMDPAIYNAVLSLREKI